MIGFNILKKVNDDCHCILILGRRRSGKSTLQAALAQQAHKLGYKCFSNYPIANCYMIPKFTDKRGRIMLDKEFLYDNKSLEHSFILLDEIASIWPARGYSAWTEQDSDFFNFLGKNDIRLFLVCQYYDTIDLNIKRSLDATWFVKRTMFQNISKIECCYHDLVKVEDLNSRVLDSKYRKITYEAAELPDRNYFFFRRKWYPYFSTTYKYEQKQKPYKLRLWSSAFRFGAEDTELKETLADTPSPLSASLEAARSEATGAAQLQAPTPDSPVEGETAEGEAQGGYAALLQKLGRGAKRP